ncbi:hypothetical protein EVAR_50024_1 [Eumeta japonica]|uniref:Uncharacterized protein n=1 Tax=Eumeta variegata TaxID=151549 RepID=A0A4C1YU13_EUMVA|nr:hypothetical protein EVAR_50024_1 [Eumeta japonica]
MFAKSSHPVADYMNEMLERLLEDTISSRRCRSFNGAPGTPPGEGRSLVLLCSIEIQSYRIDFDPDRIYFEGTKEYVELKDAARDAQYRTTPKGAADLSENDILYDDRFDCPEGYVRAGGFCFLPD